MNNARFAIGVHIMTLLAKFPGEWLSSEFIASSINVNAVIVRKEIAVLKAAGLVESRQGKEGGSTLGKKLKDIRLSDIYAAMKSSEVLGRKIQDPSPKCPVGKQINRNLDTLFGEADEAMMSFLQRRSLKDFAGNFS
ncbi:MAG: Rrf2 family transcriptional regulator [Ferruginibacter sp.]